MAVPYITAIRTCFVSPYTRRWFSPSRSRHYDMETANVMVTHNTERDNYYLSATQGRSLINIYTLTKYPGDLPGRRY